MQRNKAIVCFGAALSAPLIGAGGATATVSSTPPIVISVPATSPSGTSIVLPAGIWNASATGVYDYDTLSPGDQLADAECNTNDRSRYGPGLVDAVLYPLDLEPSPVNEWQRYRYLLPGGTPSADTGFLGDTLDVLVDGLFTEWVPPSPTIVDYSDPAGPGIVAGCDTGTHAYETVVLSDGDTPTNFAISDTLYTDNAGSITITLHQMI